MILPRLALAFSLLAVAAQAAPSAPATALVDQANAAQAKGDTQLALRLAQSAIVADPASPATYVALGDIYAGAGQQDAARNYYDEALSIDPADPAALKAVASLDTKTPRTIAKP